MNKWFQQALATMLFLLLLALTACGGGSTGGSGSGEGTSSESNSQGNIIIGAYGPLSGSTAQYGDSMKKNMEMYFEKVNSEGGVNGRKIQLIVEDDEGKPEKGINAVMKLLERDKAVAILGGPLSNVNLAAMKATQKAKIPHIATSSGNPKITESDNPYILRVVTKDTDIAASVAKYAIEVKGYSKIGVLHSSDEYGQGGAAAVIDTLKSLGKEAVAVEAYNPNDKDFTPQLTNFKNAGVDSIILWGFYTEGAIMVKQAKSLGVHAQIIGGTGLNNPKFSELAGDDVEGVLFGSPFVASDPSIKDYVDQYQAKYNTIPDMSGATGYDAAQLIVAAIKEVGTDGEKINQWLHQVKDFKGVTGLLTADQNGDLNKKVKVIEIHKDGSQTVAWDPDQK